MSFGELGRTIGSNWLCLDNMFSWSPRRHSGGRTSESDGASEELWRRALYSMRTKTAPDASPIRKKHFHHPRRLGIVNPNLTLELCQGPLTSVMYEAYMLTFMRRGMIVRPCQNDALNEA